MAEPWLGWEVPELVASLDPGIAGRIVVNHPAEGWCRSCGATAPCSMRTLAAAVARAVEAAGPGHGDAEHHC